MSEQPAKDVSPLRLKRPGSPAVPSAPATPPPSPEAVVPVPPAEPPAPAPTAVPPPSPVEITTGRRRPALSPDVLPPGITGETLIGSPPTGSASAPPPPPVSEPVHTPIKLRVGAKSPPPVPGPALPDDLFPADGGAPLMPLPGLSAMSSSTAAGGAPPPFPPAGGIPPPMPARPPGTAEIGGAAPVIGGADKPLMPLSMAGARPVAPGAARDAVRSKNAKKKAARRDLLVFAGILLVLAGLGGVGWFYLTRQSESKSALVGVKEKLEKAAELPGKAVENAKQTISGARGSEQTRVDAMAEGEGLDAERAMKPRSPQELEARLKENEAPAPAAPAETYSGGVTDGPKATVAADKPAPSARFVRFAESVSVSGVFQGSPARALVNGRLVRAGDMLEPMLGVQFVGVDAETKHLILQETGGAQVRVKY